MEDCAKHIQRPYSLVQILRALKVLNDVNERSVCPVLRFAEPENELIKGFINYVII